MRSGKTEAGRRYVGIDAGKRTYTMAVIGQDGKVPFTNGRTDPQGRQCLYGKLEPGDQVSLEAGNPAFQTAYEIKARAGCEVVVLNSSELPLMYGSMKKTDKADALKPARLIEMMKDGQLPTVPLPSKKEPRRRVLIGGQRRAKRCRTRMIHLLHGLFVPQGITMIVKKELATKEKREEAVKQFSGLEGEEAAWILTGLEAQEARLLTLKQRMEEERKGDEQLKRPEGVPGEGALVAPAFAAYAGDGSRFEHAARVSTYQGVVPRVDIAGRIVR